MSGDEARANRLAVKLVYWFDDEIANLWTHGYPVQLARLALWAAELDNRFRMADAHDNVNILKVLERTSTLNDLTSKLLEEPGLTEELVRFCQSSLTTIQRDPPHQDNLEAMQLVLRENSCLFMPRPQQINPEAVRDLEIHKELQLRLYHPNLVYRLRQGRRPDGSGSMLATISQWIPDLEAVCSLNHYILTHNIPLREGKHPMREINAVGGRKGIPVQSLEDWQEHIIEPARKFRYPQVQNPAIAPLIEQATAVDTELLAQTPRICANLRTHLESVREQEYCEHLFRLPERSLPDNNEQFILPDKLIPYRIQRKKSAAAASKSPSFDNRLLSMLRTVRSSVSHLKAEDLEKHYEQIQNHGSKVLKSVRSWLEKQGEASKSSPKSKSPKSTPAAEPQPPKSTPQDRPPIRFKASPNPLLDKIQAHIPPFEEREADLAVLQGMLGGQFWQDSPFEAARLCSRIFALFRRTQGQGEEEPDFTAAFQAAAKSADRAAIDPILEACQTQVSTLASSELQELAHWTQKSPDVREALYDAYCTNQANRVIEAQNWHKLPPQSKQKLSRVAQQQHVIQVAEKEMDSFLRKAPPLSRDEKRRLGTISITIMEQMSQFLETESENEQANLLLRRLRVLLTQYAEGMENRTEDANLEFSQACQDWLHAICAYLHDQDSQLYYAVAREAESLFVTVWKKVEHQLVQDS